MIRSLPSYRGSMLLLCLLLPFISFAQKKTNLSTRAEVTEYKISSERGTPTLIELNADLIPGSKSADAADLLRNYFPLADSEDKLELKHTTTNKEGISVAHYLRRYQGVPVEHDRYNVARMAGVPKLITAEHYSLPAGLRTSPSLSREEALVAAKNYVGASRYAWDQIEEDYLRHVWAPELLDEVFAELAAIQPGGELTIVDNYSTPEPDLDLAWKFNIYAVEPLSRAWVYVNAHTGEIMLNDRIIKHVSEPIDVVTRYAGTRQIMVDLETSGNDPNSGLPLTDSRTNLPATGNLYVLRDDTRGDGLETYDMNGVGGAPISLPALYLQSKAFTDDNLDWSLTEHKRGGTINEAENDDIAWDAHWGTQVVYDYWLDVHGRRSYDDNDVAIRSFLHYGVAYDNAFWNGTAMTYGDGSYQGGANPDGTFAPLMSLDVCGHEVGHAICTFTADLVYASESGAMNEGFSDIWGAAIEAYAFRAIDPTLENIMAPFGIGEQIDERDGGIQYPNAGWQALRYMDEPNLAGDPDTYGGANWANPDCDPNLANDQCGVHTNSGVLNKWFFLLTAGESASNDNGDAYSVAGLGFEVSERIAYGTELLLTPNATFAEARAASIAFVRTLSEDGGGACGNYEVQLTNAWYGVGVGPSFSCGILAGFTRESSSVGELVADDSSCDAAKAFIVEAAINTSGTVAVSGTATEGEDFTISNPDYDNGGNGFGTHEFIINIFDDARIEGEETIILSLGGGLTHTVTLIDNDVEVTVGDAQVTLLDASTPAAGWSTVALLDGPNSFFKTATGGQVSLDALGGSAATYDGNTAADDVILSTPLIDARGLRSLNLSFTWTAGGETDAPTDVEAGPDGLPVPVAVPLDYGNLAYSFDGLSWTDFTEFQTFNGVLLSVATGSFNAEIPAFLQGTQFYLGFRWRNDALIGGVYSFSFENPLITATGTGIETEIAAIEDDFGPNESIFFLTPDGSGVLGKVTNTSNHDFGCTTVEIATSGIGSTDFSSGGSHLPKTFTVTPTNNSATATYDVTWYYTDAEIEAYETASGLDRGDLLMFKSAMAIANAEFDDLTVAESTSITDLTGGISFTSSLMNGFSSFGVGAPSAALPVELTEFTATARGKVVNLNWTTAREENNEGFTVERAAAAAGRFQPIGWVTAERSRSGQAGYAYVDEEVLPGNSYLYRLVQRDLDGTETRSAVRIVSLRAGQGVLTFPNPVTDRLTVDLGEEPGGESLRIELLTMTGKVLRTSDRGNRRELSLKALPSGIYVLRIHRADGSEIARRIVKR